MLKPSAPLPVLLLLLLYLFPRVSANPSLSSPGVRDCSNGGICLTSFHWCLDQSSPDHADEKTELFGCSFPNYTYPYWEENGTFRRGAAAILDTVSYNITWKNAEPGFPIDLNLPGTRLLEGRRAGRRERRETEQWRRARRRMQENDHVIDIPYNRELSAVVLPVEEPFMMSGANGSARSDNTEPPGGGSGNGGADYGNILQNGTSNGSLRYFSNGSARSSTDNPVRRGSHNHSRVTLVTEGAMPGYRHDSDQDYEKW
ncbi:hypothetical protein GQX73_g10628 [Xylaria multiplex]|uniref:Uncharacterized protein n=1 Tax=Xylaria multiplex TaxID=323545 RepID=A0A7C8IKU5_9PEZI|nr:hypothetical protein GQX73_g10628 [Xylaria multiplex]